MKITFNEKEYSIKFGYKATVKSGIIKKIAKAESDKDHEDGFESVEGILLVLPELLVVGLQVHHADEFGYNIDTNEGYDDKVNKAFDFIDKWAENKENDIFALYSNLEQELVDDSFLSSLFQRAIAEEQKAEETKQKKSTKKN